MNIKELYFDCFGIIYSVVYSINQKMKNDFFLMCMNIWLQVVIVGNGGVGKSSMIQRYCRGTFTKDYKKTIGVDFLERQIE